LFLPYDLISCTFGCRGQRKETKVLGPVQDGRQVHHNVRHDVKVGRQESKAQPILRLWLCSVHETLPILGMEAVIEIRDTDGRQVDDRRFLGLIGSGYLLDR
jgi:hypothetical protein